MSAQIVAIEQGSPAWHAWRATRRMASESSALLGCSRYDPKTPLALYEFKHGLRTAETSDFVKERILGHGKRHEARARELYEQQTGRKMVPHCVERDGYGASLDGISPDGHRILELKSVVKGSDSQSPVWTAISAIGISIGCEIPEAEHVQVQHQLMTSGAEACDFGVYASDLDLLATVEVLPDVDLQARIRDAWDRFWPLYASHTPPEPVDGDFIERFDAEWLNLEALYLPAKAALKAAEAAEEKLRAELLVLAGNVSCRGEALRVTRYWSRGSVDYGKIPALKGIDTEPFRKKGAYRNRISEVNASN